MRIAIIGHFGGAEAFNDGQTVKVKALYKGLTNRLSNKISIDCIDTYYLKHNMLKLIKDLICCLARDKKIIFLPATNGRKVLFPLMYYVGKILHKDIYHDCIGGALVNEIKEHPKWVNYLNSFASNWMESEIQAKTLNSMGIRNASYLPNFKQIQPISAGELKNFTDLPFAFCTFSRVLEEKGIEDAAKAIDDVNKENSRVVATMDIYGPIQPGSEKWFQQLLERYRDCVIYRGSVEPEQSVITLKPYFALLFPTKYYTEGMPGTILDAMFSGLPVIARRWAYCDQMIKSGFNGISYDFDKPELLKQILLSVVNNPQLINDMRINCINEADKYTENSVISRIVCELHVAKEE